MHMLPICRYVHVLVMMIGLMWLWVGPNVKFHRKVVSLGLQ